MREIDSAIIKDVHAALARTIEFLCLFSRFSLVLCYVENEGRPLIAQDIV